MACGCPSHKGPTIRGLHSDPPNFGFGNSHFRNIDIVDIVIVSHRPQNDMGVSKSRGPNTEPKQ